MGLFSSLGAYNQHTTVQPVICKFAKNVYNTSFISLALTVIYENTKISHRFQCLNSCSLHLGCFCRSGCFIRPWCTHARGFRAVLSVADTRRDFIPPFTVFAFLHDTRYGFLAIYVESNILVRYGLLL